MTDLKSLISLDGLDYSHPKFNTTIKFTNVMEEVLFALMIYYFLRGKPKLTNVVDDLILLLNRSPNAIGSALKSLASLDLISYYRNGRFRTIELHLENKFLKSLLIRFFGINGYTKTNCKQLKRMIIGFYPIHNHEKIVNMVENETIRLGKLLENNQYLIDWINKIDELERLAKETQSIDESIDFNPLLLFINQIESVIRAQQEQQTADLSFQELTEIVTEAISYFKEIPPWFDDATIGSYKSMIVLDEELK